jgi:holo-[acyl-carrier protein] synthase
MKRNGKGKAMIVGTGVDIIEIERVKKAHQRFKDRFLHRLYTTAEAEYCLRKSDPYPSLAARFAAKEAAIKAFSRGFGGRWKWTLLEVVREPWGKPTLRFHGIFAELAHSRGITNIQLALSHSKRDAVATLVLESNKTDFGSGDSR